MSYCESEPKKLLYFVVEQLHYCLVYLVAGPLNKRYLVHVDFVLVRSFHVLPGPEVVGFAIQDLVIAGGLLERGEGE